MERIEKPGRERHLRVSLPGFFHLSCRAAPDDGGDFDRAAEGLLWVQDAVQQKNSGDTADLGAVDLRGGQLRLDDRCLRRAVKAGHHYVLRNA